MKRPLYYLLCAIACASMVSSTMPMAAIAEAMQPQETAEQQAQADATASDAGEAEDGSDTNAPAANTATSSSTATPTNATQPAPADANTTGAAATPDNTADTTATPGAPAATNTAATNTAATGSSTNAAPTPSLRTQTTPTPAAISTAAAETTYAHSATATQNGVTFTVSWNDAPAGTATTFHVTQINGSSQAKARMDVPTYWDGGGQESVCDPSRQAWASYHSLGAAGHDFTFDFTASGTYRIYFYFMDNDRNDPQNDKGIYYLRTMAEVTVNDAARPSVTQIVNDAVDLCRQETNGSEYDMALWLHDWTLDQLEYDHSLNWCSAESGLTRHQGTCESYQRIYSKLLNAAGVANGRITGNGHTWNAVKIDGKWCQMDLTWDDTSDNWYGDLDQRHLYFGLTDELMAIAHSDHTANYQKDDYAYRSTDLSKNYFVRNGKADEWAEKYADRIQQHLDAKEESFSIDADNQLFPPSISGIQNAIVAYAMNQRQWSTTGDTVILTTASNVTIVSSYEWSAKFDFEVEYPAPAPKADVSQADIAVADVKYTGVAMEPATTVALNGVSLKQGIDYIATYFDNVTPGTAEVAISGIGNYTGTTRKTFEIRASDVMTEFVSGLYAGGTNRRADADGFAYWLYVTKELDYENAAVCFLSSSEVANRSQTSEALISVVFSALLGREADANERARWTSSLERGTTPSDFVRTITSSREFILNHPSITVEEFVENMYREALGRPSDKEGFAYWTSAIVDQSSARNAIEAAFASTEFSLCGLNPEETVRRIYRSALLREPDKDGLEYYSGLIEKGATPLDIARQATYSQEFETVCTKCGLC